MDLWYELAIRELIDSESIGLNQRAVELRKDAEEVLRRTSSTAAATTTQIDPFGSR
jgi:hypothetical protein